MAWKFLALFVLTFSVEWMDAVVQTSMWRIVLWNEDKLAPGRTVGLVASRILRLQLVWNLLIVLVGVGLDRKGENNEDKEPPGHAGWEKSLLTVRHHSFYHG